MSSGPNKAPSSGGIRKPTDAGQINGPVVNPPRYAEWGGLDGSHRTKTSVNHSKFDIGNPFTVSKPNGGRG